MGQGGGEDVEVYRQLKATKRNLNVQSEEVEECKLSKKRGMKQVTWTDGK